MEGNASQQPRLSSKQERLRYLNAWCLQNPLATIEQARQALRERFAGVAMGTKQISDSLREAKRLLEANHKATTSRPSPKSVSLQDQIAAWGQSMRELGIRSVSLGEDGAVRVEFATRPGLASGSDVG